MYEAVRASLDNLRRFPESMGWALAEPSVQESELFCQRSYEDFMARRDFPLTLRLRETGEIIGACGLHRPDWRVPKFEIGWWGHSDFHGQGLMSEGVTATLEFAFTSLRARRVEAMPDDLNLDSCALCERVGMQFEGIMRNERMGIDGIPRNTRLYASVR